MNEWDKEREKRSGRDLSKCSSRSPGDHQDFRIDQLSGVWEPFVHPSVDPTSDQHQRLRSRSLRKPVILLKSGAVDPFDPHSVQPFSSRSRVSARIEEDWIRCWRRAEEVVRVPTVLSPSSQIYSIPFAWQEPKRKPGGLSSYNTWSVLR